MVGRGYALMALIMFGTAVGAQSPSLSWEKDGRFVAPDRGLSLGRAHARQDFYEGPQPFNVLHYNLDLQLAMNNEALSGTNVITLRLKEPVDSIVMNAMGLSLDSVLVDGVVKPVSESISAETFTIHLGEMRPAGDTLTIHIGYHRIPGYPRPSSRQGYYFFADSIGIPANLGYTFSQPSYARFWMPCYDEPWEKATMQMRLTVPDGYVAASNGRLVEKTVNGDGTTTWRWSEEHTIATYLMCITASEFAVAELPYVSPDGDTIPLQYYTWASDSAEVAAYLPEVRDMMEFYSSVFGPYPFDKYGMTAIVPFSYLGMEHQTLTTMNRFVRTNTRVVSHELAHQWWGDLVTCGTWPDIWLNESFATYSEALWRERLGGFEALKSYMKDTLEHFFFGSWQGAVYNPIGQGFNLFDDVVYSKGAWVLHTLRGVVGDSVFFNILKAYRERHKFQSAVTSELQSVVDSVVGQEMGWFFDQWIYGQGWPVYSYRYDRTSDTAEVQVAQFQDISWPTYTMPIRLLLRYSDRPDSIVVVVNDARLQSYRIPLSGLLERIDFDPDEWILKQMLPWPLGVGEPNTPVIFGLSQNYPNPFNPVTNIGFRMSEFGFVSLKVYDVLGRKVATLVDGAMESGAHVVEFDASGLSSGVYFCRLTTRADVRTIRMVYSK